MASQVSSPTQEPLREGQIGRVLEIATDTKLVSGAAGAAYLGAALAGPIGAVIGGILGFAMGSALAFHHPKSE